jgi:hypothetical protein
MERIRTVRLSNGSTRWALSLYDTGRTDSRGQSRLAYRVSENGRKVAKSTDEHDTVCGSPMHADDSDATVAAACALIAHCASHDSDDRRIDSEWDAEGFSEAAALRWPNL